MVAHFDVLVSAIQNAHCKHVAGNMQTHTCATAAAYTGGKLNNFSTAAESSEERPATTAAGAVAEHLGNGGCLCLGFPPRAYISGYAYTALQRRRRTKGVRSLT